jgi:hypothetical protein
MIKIPVKHLGKIVGYTSDGKTIEFMDNVDVKTIYKDTPIGISSRRLGEVDINGHVIHEEYIECYILNYN